MQIVTHFLQHTDIQEVKKKNPKFGKCIHDFFKFGHNSFLVGLLVYNLKKKKNTK